MQHSIKTVRRAQCELLGRKHGLSQCAKKCGNHLKLFSNPQCGCIHLLSWGWSAMCKPPLHTLKATFSILSSCLTENISTPWIPLWCQPQIGSQESVPVACLHQLSAPQTSTSSSPRREEAPLVLPVLIGYGGKHIKALCPGKCCAEVCRSNPGWNQGLHEQPPSPCDCPAFPCLPLPPLCKIVFQTHYCFTHCQEGNISMQ